MGFGILKKFTQSVGGEAVVQGITDDSWNMANTPTTTNPRRNKGQIGQI